jgi:hypothetical protein
MVPLSGDPKSVFRAVLQAKVKSYVVDSKVDIRDRAEQKRPRVPVLLFFPFSGFRLQHWAGTGGAWRSPVGLGFAHGIIVRVLGLIIGKSGEIFWGELAAASPR